MPASVTLYSCGVWLCVGIFTGMGWAFGSTIVAKLLR